MTSRNLSAVIFGTDRSGNAMPVRIGGRVTRFAAVAIVSAFAFACAQPAANAPPATPPSTPAPAPQAAVPPPLPPILPFDQAVLNAANGVFTTASKLPTDTSARTVVIDPLVDGVTGYESKATKSIQYKISDLVKRDFPKFAVTNFSPDSLKQAPLVLVGTFTAVNATNQTAGARAAYRFCLVLGDLKTGKIVAKSVARAQISDVDATPSGTFHDSPVWSSDPSTLAYIATCQATKVGDPIKQEFLDGLIGASLVDQAADAYESGRYRDALDLFTSAAETPAGDQLRVYNGLYLSNIKLGHKEQAAKAYHDLVAYGLKRNRLAVKFIFQPGTARFASEPSKGTQYGLWLREIAQQAAASSQCLEITGHTSPTGAAALNERLSFLRADYVRSRLENDAPALHNRMITNGIGSRENLVGTGKDDESDALDRRVELKLIPSCTPASSG
jgi:outer membrane protein OmpA-like peptidoglycan-associated protein